MCARDLVIVEIVRAGDLDSAGAEIRIGIFVGDDRNVAIGERQEHALADDGRIARIARMHGHRAIAQHGFGPRGGDGDVIARLPFDGLARRVMRDRKLVCLAILQRIFKVPEMAGDLLILNFEIGDRRLEMRVPIHQALVPVDQAFLVKLHEHFAHGGGKAFVQREAFAAPIARSAKPAKLIEDLAAGLRLPLPNALEEFLAPQRAAIHVGAALGELTLHHHLRGDAGVI